MTIQSSTGGTIEITKTGLIHRGDTERFITDEYTTDNGNRVGHPTKDTGLEFDFSALLTPFPKLTSVGRIVKFN